ncbi:WD-40 repeat-containing protein [Apiospora arundinis]|uniref:WD40-repeat-containing domain protein n=1 Tax=Apiospora arundinis TaxID=335852 RepID=A0ABR2JLQ9_9PEZI
MEQAQLVHSQQSLTLDLPPSCIEFCPTHPQYFVVGTYNLQKDDGAPTEDINADSDDDDDTIQVAARQSQNRNGSLVVFQLDDDEVRHVQTVQQPSAILDLHFHPQKDKSDILAVVSSTGTLSFFRLEVPSGGSSAVLTELATHQPLDGDGNTLFLSCCWHPVLHDLISVTTSAFEVLIFRIGDAWSIAQASDGPVLAHTLEAWTVAISPVSHETAGRKMFTIYSGGDDSMLLQTTCTLQTDTPVIEFAPALKTKGHGAGVTAILPLDITIENNARVLLTGSYDDHFRVYAAYEVSPKTLGMRAGLLQETNLDGGVWRLKLVSLKRQQDNDKWEATVLASCMHAGSRVLRVTGSSKMEDCAVEVVARFEEHKSMNYGSDFQPGSEAAGRELKIVSTSFYDKLLCFWVLPHT